MGQKEKYSLRANVVRCCPEQQTCSDWCAMPVPGHVWTALANAVALLPGLSKVALAESYFHAFQSLTGALALVTAGAAVTIFCLLGRRA
jgi:hypothetical protein